MATDLIRDVHIYNLAAADFAKAIRLPVETILELAKELGVILPDPSMRPQTAAGAANPAQESREGTADVLGLG